ncbi:hypothetical protein Barb7_01686 [Bacteroidales bacterium Barb7]|nr:hypothetical protein Barb7_01686 [Bacteroidales bacterium Barb7]
MVFKSVISVAYPVFHREVISDDELENSYLSCSAY